MKALILLALLSLGLVSALAIGLLAVGTERCNVRAIVATSGDYFYTRLECRWSPPK